MNSTSESTHAFHAFIGLQKREVQSWPSKTVQHTITRHIRLDKIVISRRADPGIFEANCASLPQRGRLSVRAGWQRAPECLPPQRP